MALIDKEQLNPEKTLAEAQLDRDILKAEEAKQAFDAALANTITEATALDVRNRISQQVRDSLEAIATDLADAVAGQSDETAIHYALTETANHWLASLGKGVADKLPDAEVGQAFRRAIRPRDSLTVSQWAESKRIIGSGTNLPGPWRNENAPHLTEIMDCLSEHSPVKQVTFKKSSGVGGSEILWNWIGYLIDHVQSKDAMLVVPTLDLRDREFNPRLKKMIKETPALTEKVTTKTRDSSNSQYLTEFGDGARLLKAGANSPNGLRASHLPYVMCDEVSAFPWDAGGEGDPVTLIENRQKTFGRSKRLYISTPTNAGECRITNEFEKSDQRQRHVPCPHCGHFHTLEFKNFHWEYTPDSLGDNAKRKMVDYAWFECPKCHKRIDEPQKNTMLDQGKWIPKYPHIKHHRGYHINAFYIKYGLGKTWGGIAQEWVDAQGDTTKKKSVKNTYFGEIWEDDAEKIGQNTLLSRLENFDDVKRPTIRVAGIDVQGDRLEMTIADIEKDEETWVLKHLILHGDTEQDDVWDELLDEVRENGIDYACIDSGYRTKRVKDFCKGRGWLSPIKGAGKKNNTDIEDGRPFVPSKQDVNKKLRKRHQTTPEVILGVNEGKEQVFNRLKFPSPTSYKVDQESGEILEFQRRKMPRYIHFQNHETLDNKYFEQLTAEEIRTDIKNGIKKRYFKKVRELNEALDCLVYTLAAFMIASRMKRFQAKLETSSTPMTIGRQRERLKTVPAKRTKKPASGGKLF